MITTLEKVKEGLPAVVKQVHGGHKIRQRLGGLGIHVDDSLKVLRTGFLGGPVLIVIGNPVSFPKVRALVEEHFRDRFACVQVTE